MSIKEINFTALGYNVPPPKTNRELINAAMPLTSESTTLPAGTYYIPPPDNETLYACLLTVGTDGCGTMDYFDRKTLTIENGILTTTDKAAPIQTVHIPEEATMISLGEIALARLFYYVNCNISET